MKKLITAALTISLILMNTAAFAAEAVLEDPTKGVIKISGQTAADADVKILITNPGYTIDMGNTDGARQYADTIKAGPDGKYERKVVINMDNGVSSGDFNVYVKEGDNDVTPLMPIYYASVDQKYVALKTVLADTAELTNDETVKKIFALTAAPYTSVDMSAVAQTLAQNLSANPITADDSASDEQKLKWFSDLSSRIKEIAVIQAYKEGKNSILFGKDNTFNYEDIIKITTLDSDKNVTSYNLYSTKLTAAGKVNVQNGMLKTSASSVEELQRLFVKLVMFNGIENNNDTGYGHISDYITEANVCFALNTTRGNTPVENYLSLKDKSNVNYNIMNNASSLTLENFLTKIQDYSKQTMNTTPGNSQTGSNTGSSGSGSKSSFSIGVPAGSAENTHEKNESNNQTHDSDTQTQNSIFGDVPVSHWANKAIEYLYEKNIINGVGDNTFAPSDFLTREQAVKIICTAFDIRDIKNIDPNGGQAIDITDYSMFDDVKQGQWYSESVFAAYRNSIINGVANKKFGVGMNITREDTAVILYRALNTDAKSGESNFADDSQISDYAKEAVSYMKETGLINGYDDNTFRPQNNITRAEMAQLMYNILMED